MSLEEIIEMAKTIFDLNDKKEKEFRDTGIKVEEGNQITRGGNRPLIKVQQKESKKRQR